jgi:hypothetical protein
MTTNAKRNMVSERGKDHGERMRELDIRAQEINSDDF